LARKRINHQAVVKSRGQSLLEFALVLPLLLVLVLGAMDFGRMFYIKVALTNAVREGANYLAWNPEEVNDGDYSGGIEALEAEAESLGVNIDIVNEVEITKNCPPETTYKCSGGEIEVQISKPFDLILGKLLAAFGLMDGPLTLTSTIKMVVQ